MSSNSKAIVAVLVLLAIVETVAINLYYSDAGHVSKIAVDAAAVLVVISAVAVGIERSIEFIWTAIGMTAGSFWPLTAISQHVGTLTKELDSATQPYLVHSEAAIKFLKEKKGLADDEFKKLADPLDRARKDLESLRANVKGSQQVVSYAAGANDVMNLINTQYSAVQAAAAEGATPADLLKLAKEIVKAQAVANERRANPKATDAQLEVKGNGAIATWVTKLPVESAAQARFVEAFINESGFGKFRQWSSVAGTTLTGVSDFLASFKDNPGRRVLSILMGIIGGLLVAGVAGLDVYAGVQNEGITDPKNLVSATIGGIVFTGLLMGLGSNPTHEVIKVLQENKERRKAANIPVTGASAGLSMPSILDRAEFFAAQGREFSDGQPVGNSAIAIERPVRLYFR